MKEKLQQLSDKIRILQDKNLTEEPTKMALVIPLLQILDYDVFNLDEVLPEYTSDYGVKKGEKVDYAILRNDDPMILIECKPLNTKLTTHGSQLFRYYTTTKAKLGILTDGRYYQFFTDLEQDNIMDDTPYLVIDLMNIKDSDILEFKKIHKSNYDSNTNHSYANEIKCMNLIKNKLKNELNNPSDEFVKVMTKEIHNGRYTKNSIDSLSKIIKKSYQYLLDDHFNSITTQNIEEEDEKVEIVKSKIETTELEIESYYAITSIIRKIDKDVDSVKYKDYVNHFTVFIDNIRNVLCKLHLNDKKKYIVIDDAKLIITDAKDLYKHEQLIFDKYNSIIVKIKSKKYYGKKISNNSKN